ncbi:MAG: glycerol-3-phosphate acyltransferase [Anaerolineales bacterium]|nr:glycerol-3-phosphate acyltransferase [Anaerolineales bacterium]
MEFLPRIGVLLIAYCIGSIPWGYILVKLIKGEDVRNVASGRTGGTNTMRAAGFPLGLATSLLDILKTASVVWIAQFFFPDSLWFHVLAPLIALVGQKYSIYLIRRDQNGKITFGGGAGGTPAVGGIIGFWWPSIFILVPAGYIIVMIIGYASLATMSLPLIGALILLIRYLKFGTPWQYILFGLLAEIFIVWALRPNIKRLINGTERLVGIRAKKANKIDKQN